MNTSNIDESLPPNDFLSVLINYLHELESEEDEVRERLKCAPVGHLRVSMKGDKPLYYHITRKGDTNGKYIKKDQDELISQLAQKEYDAKALPDLRKKIKMLKKLVKEEERLESWLCKSAKANEMHHFIPDNPARLSDAQYSDLWKAISFKTKGINPEEQRHFSSAGLPVRSKSEELIANALDAHGVPFRYEAPVEVDGTWYPDFYCLNVHTRQEFIWEHFGLMDDVDYQDTFAYKINTYQAHGFLIGRDLIFTSESKERPLSSADIEQMIKTYLL